jgi:Leucine-rich repeat (LRR) protein
MSEQKNLITLLTPLATTTECHQLIKAMDSEVKQIEFVDSQYQIIFKNNLNIILNAPYTGKLATKSSATKSMFLVAQSFNGCKIEDESNSLIWFGMADGYTIEAESAESKASVPIIDGQNWIAVHPKLKTEKGEPILARIYHGKNDKLDPIYPEFAFGPAFLRLLAQRLGLGINSITTTPIISWPEDRKITSLDLSNMKLETLDATLGEFTELKTLNLAYNKLTCLPPEIGKLKKLELLSLHMNPLKTLPVEVAQLSNLQELYLMNTHLKQLPELDGLRTLEKIDFKSAKLTSLPESIGKLTRLKNLNLSENKLTDLPKSFGELKNLKILNLDQNPVEFLPQLCELEKLERLRLNATHATAIPETIIKLKQLRHLYMDDNKITQIPEELLQLQNLILLSALRNKINYFPEPTSNCGLTHIWLNNNLLTDFPKKLFPHLEELWLKKNPLAESIKKEIKDIYGFVDI